MNLVIIKAFPHGYYIELQYPNNVNIANTVETPFEVHDLIAFARKHCEELCIKINYNAIDYLPQYKGDHDVQVYNQA